MARFVLVDHGSETRFRENEPLVAETVEEFRGGFDDADVGNLGRVFFCQSAGVHNIGASGAGRRGTRRLDLSEFLLPISRSREGRCRCRYRLLLLPLPRSLHKEAAWTCPPGARPLPSSSSPAAR